MISTSLEKRRIADTIRHPANLPEVGLSLISWLRADGASHTFLAPAPSFEYVNDYRVIPFGIETKDDIAIIVPRQVEALHYPTEVQETVQRSNAHSVSTSQTGILPLIRSPVISLLPTVEFTHPTLCSLVWQT